MKKKLILEYDACKNKKQKPTKETLKKCGKALEMKCYRNIASQL